MLIGPSGAGKGTQAERLAATRQFVHLSTGDLFRDALRRDTALGRRVRHYIERGELVPEEITEAVIRQHLTLANPSHTLLLDGYPRTLYQATTLDEILRQIGDGLEAILYLKVSDSLLVNDRIPGRLTCAECQRPYHERHKPARTPGICDVCGGRLERRSDDTSHWAQARLRIFHRQTSAVVEHYQKAGQLIVLDGAGDIGTVHGELDRVLGELDRHEARRATKEESRQIADLREPPRTLPAGGAPLPSLDLVVLGAPGSGKGTQAAALRRQYGLVHLSTGDLFRDHVKRQTPLGRLARSYMDRGDLVPDSVTEEMVRERLSEADTAAGFILDGFPRTLPQAEALTDMLTDLQRRLSGVLYIEVSDEEIVRRLSGRWICRDCQTPYHAEFHPPARPGTCDVCGGELYQREDDRPETVRSRLRTFHRATAPLADYYREAGLLVPISGEGDVAEVTRQAVEGVEPLRR